MSEADDVRGELEAAMPPHQTWCQTIGHFDCCGASDSDCDCGIKDSLDEIEAVVIAYGDRIAREMAADELDAEAVYDDAEPDALYPRRSFAARVRERARNLRAEATP